MAGARKSDFEKAFRDLANGLVRSHLWRMLAWQEIRQRYRRSLLGPFWLTISMGIMLGAMGPLYGKLFGQDISSYLPHLAVGYVVWILISSLVNEGCNAFILSESLIKQAPMPLSVHVFRMIFRNLIISAHHLLIVAAVLVLYPPKAPWELLFAPVGVLAIAVNGVWVGLLLGILCARFRDIPLIVQSVMQVAFFLTPVLWKPGSLGGYAWIAIWNPFYSFVEIVRAPMLGLPVGADSLIVVLAVTIAGSALALALFARYRARIAYWV